MAMVSPSILSANFAHLEEDCRKALDGGAAMLHYDVMDGHFVPNISFGIPVLKSIHKAVPEAFFDVHLMISHPIDYIQAFADAGAELINFHIESRSGPWETLRKIQQTGCKTGMTVKPATPVESVFPYLDQLDLVLIMSVEPGFGGQKFMASALEKVSKLAEERKQRGLGFLIELDGGINAETGMQSMAAGADVLVAGSTIFGAENITAACQKLSEL